MSDIYTYVYEDDHGREREIEVHYEYIKGLPAKLNAAPEDCHPAEDPEINILYFMNPLTGNEILDDELPVSVEDIIDAIIDHHCSDYEEDEGDEY
jgi:hypothetical protein